jgi:NADH-quinone oxidoreductase subunit E
VLAGFPDDRADEGPAAGPATLLGLRIAKEQGWSAPDTGRSGAAGSPADTMVGAAEQSDASDDASAMRVQQSGSGTHGGKDEVDE